MTPKQLYQTAVHLFKSAKRAKELNEKAGEVTTLEAEIDFLCDVWGLDESREDIRKIAKELVQVELRKEEILKASGRTLEDVARTFSGVLREWLGADFAEMVEKAKKDKEGVCSSHDYCDANMAMDEAFQKELGIETDIQLPEHMDIFNEAWDIAKKNNFYIGKP